MSSGGAAVTEDRGTTIGDALGRAAQRLRGGDSPRLDAEVLLAHVLDQSRAFLLARPERTLPVEEARRFDALVHMRAAGWPIAYLTGHREFWSRTLHVTPDTLIPRPETERLVELALRRIPNDRPRQIADLGTGSGAVALAIALERPACRLVATDISAAALGVARHNATRLHVRNIEFRQTHWCDELHGRGFDLIVANPPYVRRGDPYLARGDLRFEPLQALESGADGLEDITRIAAGARNALAPGGRLLLEHGHDQGPAVAALLARYGYGDIECHNDLGGIPRVVEGVIKGLSTQD